MNYTYVLRCDDGSYYTGWTNDLRKRYHAHCTGHGAKYTRMHHPVCIAYYETFADFHDAMHREWEIKQMSHIEKEKLVSSFTGETASFTK